MILKKPVDAIISQRFGNSAKMYTDLGLKGHNGIDFACKIGTKIIAVADGEVSYCGGDSIEGIGVVIIHKFPEGDFKSIYWHLSSFSVKLGDKIKAGQQIALSGNTGRSTGPHLHFGFKPITLGENKWTWWNTEQKNGYAGAIDPFPYFEESPTILKIKELQTLLNKWGAKLLVDGSFGKLSNKALLDFLE